MQPSPSSGGSSASPSKPKPKEDCELGMKPAALVPRRCEDEENGKPMKNKAGTKTWV